MRLISIIAIIILAASCKEKPAASKEIKNNDSIKFFQVTDYLRSQINEVNKTPYFIYRLNIVNGQKDSVAINTAAFSQIAEQFLQPDINDLSIKKYYTESVFFDETTKSFNISYATTNKELPLQNVDILLKEDGKTVKRVMIRKFKNYSDSSAVEQLSWKPNESFQVIRLVQNTASKNETSQQTVVVWNEKG